MSPVLEYLMRNSREFFCRGGDGVMEFYVPFDGRSLQNLLNEVLDAGLTNAVRKTFVGLLLKNGFQKDRNENSGEVYRENIFRLELRNSLEDCN